MGLGAANEIVEFEAVLSVPEANVGGYLNTTLDLAFNALGADVAMTVVAVTGGRPPGPPDGADRIGGVPYDPLSANMEKDARPSRKPGRLEQADRGI